VEKIWLKNYQKGVPEYINPDSCSSLPDMFDPVFKQFADRNAFYSFGTYLTYKELDEQTLRFAAVLQKNLQLKKGDRFAVMLPNILQYPIVLFGALRAGITIVNINPLYTADELTNQLNDSGATAIVVLEQFAHTVQETLLRVPHLKHCIITKIGDLLSIPRGLIMEFALKYILHQVPPYNLPNALNLKSLLDNANPNDVEHVDLQGHDIAFLQYTGGTTGVSKGAMLTHRNIIANLLQADAWLTLSNTNEHEIIITALPLYRILPILAD